MKIPMLAIVLVFSCSLLLPRMSPAGSNFYDYIDITRGDGCGKMLEGGQLLPLSLDRYTIVGRIDIQLKLIPGNSAVTVTTYYSSSQGPAHNENDFEFFCNLSRNLYKAHTNMFTQGKGDREQQFYLRFDPTLDFHTYSILCNPQRILEFANKESIGVAFPNKQAMRAYFSLWNADDWPTMGGRVKTGWSKSPFVASYRNFNTDTSSGGSSRGGGGDCGGRRHWTQAGGRN